MSNLNKIHRKVSKIFSIAIIALLTLTNSISYANETENLKSGVYEVKNEVHHDSEVGVSMARSYTAEVMELKYTKEKLEYKVTFTGTDYMENYRILVNDEPVDFEIVDEDKENTSITLSFNVVDINDKITAQIYVSAMERDVEFEVKPLVETLNLIEEIEEPKEEVSSGESNKESNEENNTSEKSSISPLVIGAVVIIVVAVAFILIKKK